MYRCLTLSSSLGRPSALQSSVLLALVLTGGVNAQLAPPTCTFNPNQNVVVRGVSLPSFIEGDPVNHRIGNTLRIVVMAPAGFRSATRMADPNLPGTVPFDIIDEYTDANQLKVFTVKQRDTLPGKPTGISSLTLEVVDLLGRQKVCEFDHMPDTKARVEIQIPKGASTVPVVMGGPATIYVDVTQPHVDLSRRAAELFGPPSGLPEGPNGREELYSEMVQLNLTAASGPFAGAVLRLRQQRRTKGQIEEKSNLCPGRVDLEPLLRWPCHGDINFDGKINNNDVFLMQDWLLGVGTPAPGTPAFLRGDVDGNGQLNLADLNLIVDVVLGRRTSFPVAVSPCPAGGCLARSFFEVYFELVFGGMTLHNKDAVIVRAEIDQKPPAAAYVHDLSLGPVDLYDESETVVVGALITASHITQKKLLNSMLIPIVDGQPRAGGGYPEYKVNSKFQYVGTRPIVDPYFKVVKLEGAGCPCQVVAAGPTAGALTPIPNLINGPGAEIHADVGSDALLTPGEVFTEVFQIHLTSKATFSFYVDVYGWDP